MEQNLFEKLPPEISIDILSRLPLRTTVICKSVSKPWFNLIETPEFAKTHLARSAPALAVFQGETCTKPYRILECIDEDGTEHQCNLAFDFSFPHPKLIHSSVDGLLLIVNCEVMPPHSLFICNPIAREYIEIPSPRECDSEMQMDNFGFGVSKMSGQYKVVRVYSEFTLSPTSESRIYNATATQFSCQVYTLGTGSWRSISPGDWLSYAYHATGVFLDGSLHWLACDSDNSVWISTFDLETEVFGTGSSPGLEGGHDWRALSTLRGCLCLCDNSADDMIAFWLVKENAGKYWTKEFNISKRSPNDFYGVLCPVKVFKDGDVLIAREYCSEVLCYSSKTRTIAKIALIGSSSGDRTSCVSYTPNFLRLKTFPKENVSSF